MRLGLSVLFMSISILLKGARANLFGVLEGAHDLDGVP